MGIHIFTKIKNTDGWIKKKNAFFSYFISGISEFSYMGSSRKFSMFRRSIPLNQFEHAEINGDVNFFRLQPEIPFLGKFDSKYQNCQFKVKLDPYTNSNMQN